MVEWQERDQSRTRRSEQRSSGRRTEERPRRRDDERSSRDADGVRRDDDGARRRDDDGARRRERATATLPATEAATAGLRQIAALTGREAQGVVSLEPSDEGWVVGVEVVEDRRIPASADILALYEATIDQEGELTGYARKRRYARGANDPGDSG
jgi:hypothetical protein